MYHDLPSAAFLQVCFRQDTRLLTGRWQRSVTDEEMQQGYEALRLAALYHDCCFWLVDARRRISRAQNGPEWVLTHFLPEVQSELGEVLHVSFLVLPDYLQTLENNPEAWPDSAVQYARFVDEGAANAWLAACQAGRRA
ncbi:hypothetical protein [Hymenobacter saemangeumensis]